MDRERSCKAFSMKAMLLAWFTDEVYSNLLWWLYLSTLKLKTSLIRRTWLGLSHQCNVIELPLHLQHFLILGGRKKLFMHELDHLWEVSGVPTRELFSSISSLFLTYIFSTIHNFWTLTTCEVPKEWFVAMSIISHHVTLHLQWQTNPLHSHQLSTIYIC